MFNEKTQKLQEAAIQLKKDFCGLDDIIDKIISTITSWYIMSDLQTRPLVINLWGLTGTGKTDLVRKLVQYIGFYDNFLEVHIPSQSSDYNSLHYIMSDSGVSENSPGIILLDEFQGFRSKDEQGKQIQQKTQQDIWQLLSDGKISNKHDFLRELSQLYLRYKRKLERIKSKKIDNDNDDDFGMEFENNIFELDKLKHILGLNASIHEMLTWTTEYVSDIIEDAYNNTSKYIREANYTQCLIFICGNLDDAYTISDAITEVDLDPDVFYEMTKHINILDIKKSLIKLFKPEQIARLGNIHIIYPSFTNETYKQIITQKLNQVKYNIKKKININITFDNSIIDFIFKNGVFPAQGTRPVYSTISYCIEAYIPKIIMNNPNKKNIKIKITNKNQKWYINNIEIPSDIQLIRDKINIEDIKMVAVHEAGHILANVYVKKIIPKIATARAISSNSAGYVIANGNNNEERCKSKKDLLNDITVLLAGYCAERYVFKDDTTTGGSEDLGRATDIALDMIRIYGMGNNISWINHPNVLNSDDSSKSNYQLNEDPIVVEETLQILENRNQRILQEREEEFKALIKLLIEKDILIADDIENIVGKIEQNKESMVDKFLS